MDEFVVWLCGPRALTSPFIHVLNRERAKAEGALADALQKVAELEDQLDKAGGDAAAERQAMRALEAANKEGLEEVSGRGVCLVC